MLITLVTACLLAASPDAPLRASPSILTLLATPEQGLREEIVRVEGSRPSGRWFIPAGILGGAGTLMALSAGILNIDIRSCKSSSRGAYSVSVGFDINCRGAPHQTNPLTGPLLGIGVGALVVAVGIVVAVTVIRRHCGPRLDRLKQALSHLEMMSGNHRL